jgi:hypothetical protein
MQNLIKNLENIHSIEELNKVFASHCDSESEITRAFRKARNRIYEEQRTTRRNEEQKFRSNLAAEICRGHDLNYESCKMIVDRAWMSHHSYGNQEVTDTAHSLVSFIEKIIKNEQQ